MESVETGECLWLVTSGHVFGIRVEKLQELGKNEVQLRHWKSNLPPPPFDFFIKLPQGDITNSFLFHSNLFFAGGPPASSTNIYQLSYLGGTTLAITDAVAAGTVPPPPTLLYDRCYVANIQGDVYLLVHDSPVYLVERKMGFWVLRSGSKEWHPLPLPPSILRSYSYSESTTYAWWHWHCLVWKDKLFLEVDADPETITYPRKIIFYVYDPQADDHSWHQLKEKLPFSSCEDGYSHVSIMAVSSLGDVGNCSVAMTWSMEDGPPSYKRTVKIHALMVDNQDYCIRRRQCLEEACEAIIPSSFNADHTNVKFVDLGKGKVCVLIVGFTKGYPMLCVLVLGLALLQGGEQEHQGQRFLSVEVLVNQVYDMKACQEDMYLRLVPCSSFLYSFSKGMPTQTCLLPRSHVSNEKAEAS
ncbi:hypothetical protein PIB30_019068 [Stylosanthes scabra]|uniref:Uncharacterized protein n=1 Tax=Stylosanthes scabra TaxID=79078 RepID=A0ABU6T8G5_9FABA|nr:hypothetical protein [Stylosanthes scabra]